MKNIVLNWWKQNIKKLVNFILESKLDVVENI